MKFYVLDGKTPRAVADMMEWAAWMETADRQVMNTVLVDGSRVSTVFLGLDHSWRAYGPPILFETMIFADDGESEIMARYSTWAEAMEGHMEVLQHCELPALVAPLVR